MSASSQGVKRKDVESVSAKDGASVTALGRSVERFGDYKAFFENLLLAVYFGNESQAVQWTNRHGLKMLGIDSIDELGGNPADIVERLAVRDPYTGVRLTADEIPLIRALKHQTQSTALFSYTHLKTGEEVVVRCTSVPLFVGEGVNTALSIHTDMTGEFVRERARQLSERRLRLLVDAMPSIAWLVDNSDGNVLWHNQRFFDYTGAPEIKRITPDWQALIHPDDLEMCDTSWMEAHREKTPWELAYRLRRHDGIYRWHLGRCTPIREDGTLNFWLGNATDIDDFRRLEEERYRIDRYARRVLEEMSDAFVSVDAEWRIIVANRAALSRFGDSNEDTESWVGRNFGDIWPHEFDAIGAERCRLAMESRVAQHFETKWPHPGHLGQWVDVDVYPAENGGVHIFYRDITERKNAESRVRRLFDNNVVGTIRWNLDTGAITDCNDLFLELTGYSRADVETGLLNFRDMTPADWAPRNEIGVETIRTTGFTAPYEKEYLRKDGSRIPILIGGALFEGSTNEGMSYVVDISERKAAENALQRSEERYRILTLAANQVIWTVNREGNANADLPLWAEYTGQTTEEFSNDGFLNAIHPDDRARVRSAWSDAQRLGTVYECEYRLWNRNQGYRHTLARAVPVRDASGNILEWIGANEDIEARKSLEIEQARQARKNERIAETLQRSLLLTPSEKAFPGVSVAAIYEAAWEEAKVGGDFCDIFALEGNRIVLVIGDVTGKGLRAASQTAEVKYALRAFLREGADGPSVLARLNRHIHAAHELDVVEGIDSETGFDSLIALCLVLLDIRTGALECVAGGAEPPLIVRAASGNIEEIPVRGILIGAEYEPEYEMVHAYLAPGDLLLCVTDGVTESRRGREFYGTERLMEIARSARSMACLQDLGKAIVADALQFSEGNQKDDICLLIARRDI